MKKRIVLLLSILSTITVFLIVIGLLFDRSELEKQHGLTEVYDVSSDGTIAYVAFNEGEPGIYIKESTSFNRAVVLDNTKVINDISFSPSGNVLSYVVTDKQIEDELHSTVFTLNMDTLEVKEVFHDPSLITEIMFDPKNEQTLFYLRAGTFENYSPIASARPHNVDVFSYDLEEQKRTRHTNENSYSMNSLHVSSSEEAVFVQFFDEADDDTAEDIFANKQRVFKIPLNEPESIAVVSNMDREADIYDFTIVPNKQEMIYQSISNMHEGGTYEYELYHFNWETGEEKQLTHLKQYTSRPRLTTDSQTIYFMVDKQFAQGDPDYYLYQMDYRGKNIKEMDLSF